jgi:hypothetical protein
MVNEPLDFDYWLIFFLFLSLLICGYAGTKDKSDDRK